MVTATTSIVCRSRRNILLKKLFVTKVELYNILLYDILRGFYMFIIVKLYL